MLEFRVLGPLEVRRDGRPVEVRGSKRRAVLALLVLQANEVVRTDRLIDDLWGADRPANAAGALHNHLSRLRKDLGEDVVVTKPWGYVLRAAPEAIDLRRFESLVDEARPLPARERSARLGEALGLWRGPALADLAHELALNAEIGRLDELRESVVEQRIDARLELGEHAEVIRELEKLIAEHPLRERLRGQLILALYRSGRQAEALETYRETRRVLVEELGIEPSAELRELERAILRQDPSLVAVFEQTGPETEDRRPPPSRWRWPRSPLIAGVAALLLVLTGVAVAILATPRSGTSHADAAEGPAAVTAVTKSGSTMNEEAVISKKNLEASAVPGREPRRRHEPPPPSPTGSSADGPTTKPPKRATTAQSPRKKPVAENDKPKPKPEPKPKPKPKPTTPPPPPPPPPPSPPSLGDRTAWWSWANQQGLTISQAGGQVTFTIPATARDEFNAGIATRCKAHGNFDARAGFRLVQWPGADGVWVSLMTSNVGGVNTYRSDSFGEIYGTYIPESGGTSVPATGNRGELRLKREGNMITGLYRQDADWVTIFQGAGPTGDTGLTLSVFNLDFAPFAGRAATVTFDTFALTADAFASC